MGNEFVSFNGHPVEDATAREKIANSDFDMVKYPMETDCNRTLFGALEIPLMTSDGKLIGSGLKYNDILTRPRNTSNGALAFFDNKGNLLTGSLNALGILTTAMLLLETATGKDNTIRLQNGYQICWGKASQELTFTETGIVTGKCISSSFDIIGFPKSFSEIPTVFLTSDAYPLSTYNCNQNAILSATVSAESEEPFTDSCTLNWLAIGKWN